MMTLSRTAILLLAAIAVLTLSACSPKFDWREVQGPDSSFLILMPAKPLTISRPVNLDGVTVTMTMTAADIDGVSFAVGMTELPDQAHAAAALDAMKTAMVNNINGNIRIERLVDGAAFAAGKAVEIEARGTTVKGNRAQSMLLLARFAIKGKRAYQAVVVGPETAVSREAAETFLTSFKLN